MRRPRPANPQTPASATGQVGQKSPRFAPTSAKFYSGKVKHGRAGGYRVSGKKHGTEAY
jgi:hypothetical protein